MDTKFIIPKTSSRSQLGPILQLGSHANEQPPSSSVPEAAMSTNTSAPIGRSASHGRRASIIFSGTATLPSFLRNNASPISSPSASSPSEKTGSSKRVRELLQPLSQMATPESTNKEVASTESLSTTLAKKQHSRSASNSSAQRMQRVKSFILPRPSLPEMPQKKPKLSLYGSVSSSSTQLQRSDVFREPSLTAISVKPESPITTLNTSCSIEDYSIFEDTFLAAPQVAGKRKRRMSFDFASLKQPLLASSGPSSPTIRAGVTRSKTLTAHREGGKSADKLFGSTDQLNDRQRALNVRRARKMLMLFGSEPPMSLYQVCPTDEKDEDGLIPSSAKTMNRDSLKTIVSLASLSTSIRRTNSASSVIFVAADVGEGSKANTLPSPSFTPRAVSESLTPSNAPTTFSARRRRAAKLARFFGVGYKDLSSATTPASVHKLSASESACRTPPTSVGVNVQMTSPSRFWGIMDGRRNITQDADMDDVIGKLRVMKAR